MKPGHKFILIPAVLGAMTLLTGCHDKAYTVELQDQVRSLEELVSADTLEIQRINNASQTLAQQARTLTAQRVAAEASSNRSRTTREQVTRYREAVETAFNEFSTALAKYRREQLVP